MMDAPTTPEPEAGPHRKSHRESNMASNRVPTWRLWLAPIVWAAHFLAIYVFTALACARVGTSDWYTPAAVPWFVGSATLLASMVLLWTIVSTLRAGWNARSQALAQAPSRDFIGWLSAAIAALVLIAVLWETLALVWLPACG